MSKKRKTQLLVFSALVIFTLLSYKAHSPLKYVLGVLGVAACVYSGKKLKEQFGIPLVFRRGKPNYWGGAFGGLIGGITGFYGATRDLEKTVFAEFGVDISLITIYLVLGCILFMGTVFQDIEDGYLEV